MTRRFTNISMTLAASFILLISMQMSATAQGTGRVEYVDGVRVVHLAGSPYEIGKQHGTLLKSEINALLDYFFKDKGSIFGASPDLLAKTAPTLKKNIPAEYLQEMRGISDGSGVDFDKILYTNIFLDVVSAGWAGAKVPGCANFAALGSAAKDGGIVHGRNLDWTAGPTVAQANTVFFITPEKGVPFASLSWPGMVGTLTGLNTEQISMGEMTSLSTDATFDGMPIMTQLRMLLQYSKSLDDAYKILADNKRTTGYNVLVTDGKTNDGFVVEMNAKSILKFAPENGILVHTNHYIDKKMLATQKKLQFMFYGGGKTDTNYRYERLTELLKSDNGKIDVADAEKFLSDKLDPLENKVSGKLDNTVCQNNTLQSVVMLPKSQELYVALKTIPAPDGGYVKIKFVPDALPGK